MRKVRTVFHLEERDAAALKGLSKKTGAPVSELLRRAVAEYLKKQK